MAMMGNSITYGAKLSSPSTECYPARLSQMLSEIYGDTCEIMNYGVSGRTMMRSSESPLWKESKFTDALKYVPDICLILLGTNDSKPYRWEAWGDEFLNDYLAMIDTFKFRNPYTRFIVCYPPPIWEGHPYGTTFENSHNDSIVVNCIIPLIDSVVEKTGAILIDFHTPFVDSLQYFPDKLHPDAEGSGIMAEILFDTIIERDLIHQVETGLAFVSSFDQMTAPAAIGDSVELRWSTVFADSVFVDGVPVDPSGSIKVIAEESRVYTLTAKGSKNTSDFHLRLNTYFPEVSGLNISISSYDYKKGKPVFLYSAYVDQYQKEISENTNNVTWNIIEGEGQFGDQTDTSIVFIPTATGKVVIEAKEGELSAQRTFWVNSLTFVSDLAKTKDIKVFPNPVTGVLYFQFENLQGEDIQIKVFNMLGVKLLEHNFSTNGQGISKFKLNTSGLDQGVYVYTVIIDACIRHGQFIKSTNHY
jgi:lysophospholipase L1-like esterase